MVFTILLSLLPPQAHIPSSSSSTVLHTVPQHGTSMLQVFARLRLHIFAQVPLIDVRLSSLIVYQLMRRTHRTSTSAMMVPSVITGVAAQPQLATSSVVMVELLPIRPSATSLPRIHAQVASSSVLMAIHAEEMQLIAQVERCAHQDSSLVPTSHALSMLLTSRPPR